MRVKEAGILAFSKTVRWFHVTILQKFLAYPHRQGRNMHRISELLGVEDSPLLYMSNSSDLSPMNPMHDVRQTWPAYLI